MAIIQKTSFAEANSDLKTEADHANGDVAFVAKRLAADTNNDGGGIFVYDATCNDLNDDATVIKPTLVSGAGRWVRRVDVRGPFHAEWFGAVGNGTTDAGPAINACLDKFNRVDLLAKTYLVDCTEDANTVRVKANAIIQGQGMHKTTLHHKGETTGDPEDTFIPAIQTHWEFYDSGVDNVVIRDLTIDCGFDDEDCPRNRTRRAVDLRGANNLVERVRVVNFGVGAAGSECFVIAIGLGSSNTSPNNWMGTVRECMITAPGDNSSVEYEGPIPEITCIILGGYSSAARGAGGSIVGNKIFNMPYGLAQRSPLHGITIADCVGTEIAGNEIINFDGAAVYWGSNQDEDVLVRNNRLINVVVGIHIGVDAANQLHARAKLCDNLIVLGKYVSLPAGTSLCGVFLTVANGLSGDPLLQGCLVQRNFIRGENEGSVIAIGVALFFNSTVFDGINVEDNVLELPDQGGAPSLNTPYENALWFGDKLYYAPEKIRLGNNRNMAGSPLRLKIVTYTQPVTAERGPYAATPTRIEVDPYDSRTAKLYEEFMGQPYGYALGWKEELADGGKVVSVDGEDGRVGIVKLTAGESATGKAILRLGALTAEGSAFPFKLDAVGGSNAGRVHVFEFSLRRGRLGVLQQLSYQFRAGLMSRTEACDYTWAPAGVYLKCQPYYEGNWIRAFTIISAPSQFQWLPLCDDTDLAWRRVRMEVSASRAVFYLDGVCKGALTQYIPKTTPLLFAFCIHGELGTSADRMMLVDNFSYQVL